MENEILIQIYEKFFAVTLEIITSSDDLMHEIDKAHPPLVPPWVTLSQMAILRSFFTKVAI